MYGEPLRLGGHPLRANGRVCRVAPGALSVPPYVSESCVPGGGSAGGSSIVVRWVPGTLSLGCSFATLSAAHREMHSRLQPHEQITSQRGVSEVIEGRRLDADARSLEHLVSVVLEPFGADDELRLPQRPRPVADVLLDPAIRS